MTKYRIGIDIGGTFTDFVLLGERGRVTFGKVITNAVVDALTLAGTMEEVTERVVALGRAGIGQIMVHPFAAPGHAFEDTIRCFTEEVAPVARKALAA